MNVTRTVCKDVTALRSLDNVYLLGKNQYFCETPKAYEIWTKEYGDRRVTRIPKKSIYWVFTDPAYLYGGEMNPAQDTKQ